MRKFLFNFRYNGKRFSGLQKQSSSGKNDNSIVKYLEQSLLCLSPLNTPTIYISSRTDAGVHAIASTFSAFLNLPPYRNNEIERFVTSKLNKYFLDSALDIRLNETKVVPSGFDCRKFALSRSYLYRIAWIKASDKGYYTRNPLPELGHCHFIESPVFDLYKAQCICETLKGTHNFLNFCKVDRAKPRPTVRTINEVKIVGGKSFFDSSVDDKYKDIECFDIVISSRGFLWRQVRCMVGAIVSVATGHSSVQYIQSLLLNTRVKVSNITYKLVPPDGLYLLNIEYPPETFLEETYKDIEKYNALRQKYFNWVDLYGSYLIKN